MVQCDSQDDDETMLGGIRRVRTTNPEKKMEKI
jgi:hypothetical protein